MNDDFVDYENLEQVGFSFRGNYRAIVEDTNDPQQSGRVRVRILGLHYPDSKSTPVENLPWAMPALSLYHAGGKMTADSLNEDVNPNERYLPKKDLKGKLKNIPGLEVTEMTPTTGEWKDEVTEECGSSAIYTVPRKGSMVWVFFEQESHLACHYWAASPRVADWEIQRDHIDNIIKSKRDDISDLRTKTSQGSQKIDKNRYTDSQKPVERIKVETSIPDPKLFLHTLDNIKNQDMTSFTTATGTTYVIVHEDGKERTYIFHKGETQYVDEYGQVKHFIGLTDDGQGNKTENDYQVAVANNHDLYIMGDFNTYIRNNYKINSEKDLQAVVQRNVGIVAKKGDVDIKCEKGHVNISCPEGNVNVRCQEMQSKVEKNLVLEVSQDIDAKIGKNVILNISGDANINASQSINLKSSSDLNIDCTGAFKLKAQSIDLYANTTFKQTGQTSLHLNSNQEIKCKASAASTLELDTSGVKLGGSITDLAGETVKIGGIVEMGSATKGTGGTDATQATVTVEPWADWRSSPEKIVKENDPTKTKVTDEDNAS
jgi:hypothetical protein